MRRPSITHAIALAMCLAIASPALAGDVEEQQANPTDPKVVTKPTPPKAFDPDAIVRLLGPDRAPPREPKITLEQLEQIKVTMKGILRQCYKPPAGSAGSRAVIDFQLEKDGSLADMPKVIEEKGPLGSAVARAAMRAILICSPFPLPPELHVHWREMAWVFDVDPDKQW